MLCVLMIVLCDLISPKFSYISIDTINIFKSLIFQQTYVIINEPTSVVDVQVEMKLETQPKKL